MPQLRPDKFLIVSQNARMTFTIGRSLGRNCQIRDIVAKSVLDIISTGRSKLMTSTSSIFHNLLLNTYEVFVEPERALEKDLFN